ncbi:MAG: SUMF1/EgtB/PvdO family nonheme iron enzyme [Kiritimatiellia bacterium]
MRTRLLFALALACPALAVCAATPEANAAARRAREQLARFTPEAARRAMADLKTNPKYDYAKHNPAVEALIAKLDFARTALEKGTDAEKAEAVGLVEGYRAAMLANPILDFDKILCVHRKINGARGAFGGRGSGMTGLNAENHMVAPRTGFENEIGVLSDLRGTPKFTPLYKPADKTSIVRDIDLDFDASRILFTGYKGTNNLFGIYEVKADFSKLAPEMPYQTPTLVSPEDGGYDIQWWDASYLPNQDQVIMLGTAAYQFLPCEDGNMPMAVIYRVDRKTGEVRQLTYEQDSDYTPSITHDGRVLYTRWEYSDQPHYWSRVLMTMNPDGVGQLSVWGSNSYVPTFFYCARTIPGDPHKITMIGGGHHDRAEVGRMFIVDPTLARAYPSIYDPPDRDWGPARHTLRIPFKTLPKERTGLAHEFPGWGKDVEGDMADPYTMNQFARGKPYFLHPYPLSENYHLAGVKSAPDALIGLYLVDRFDNITLIAECEDGLYCEPIPFCARKRPPIIPDRSRKGETTCSVHIADIYNGPGLAGIPRGTVKKLRLFSYHYNYHKTGGHSSTGWIKGSYQDRVESSWDVKRPLGTVDIESDGSCCFEMPANTPVSVQPLDEEGRAVQLMRSWIVGMPGERVSCTGCHEDNRSSVHTKRTIADEKYFKGEMQKIKPIDGGMVRPWAFENELYPVVRKYCLGCHGDPEKAPLAKCDQGGAKEVKVDVFTKYEQSGKRLVMDNAVNAYKMLHPYIRRPGPEGEEALLPPMDYHASTSPLVQMLRKGHHGVQMEQKDLLKIYEWIDLNAPFWGKWNPPAYASEGPDPKDPKKRTGFMWAEQKDQVARRLELQKRYANVPDNPEAEHDAYHAIVTARVVTAVAPTPKPVAAPVPKLAGWPMDELKSADAQLGAIHEIAPVTTKTLVLGDGQSLTFRRIPAGQFVMGSATGYADERPMAVVKIDRPFWISEMEIRNDQYHVFDPNHDSRYQDEFGKDHVFPGHIGNHRRQPVVRVTWNDAMRFCVWLSKTCGVKANLPTEAQWEWAARAGTDTPFPWGGLDDDFSKFANFADRDTRFQVVGFDGGGNIRRRHPFRIDQNYPLHDERWQDDWFNLNFVGRANCNRWGLYDMHGNASEWTRSDYAPYPYVDGDGRNACNPQTKKVARGGSFASRPRDGTSSYRLCYEPWQTVFDVGFRVILECE